MNTGGDGLPGNGGAEAQAPPAGGRPRSTEPRTTEQAASAAHEAIDLAAEAAARAEERLREAAITGEQRLREKSAEARHTAERTLEQVRQYTRNNPFAAAGIAFAAGIIVSRLLSRR